MTHARDGQKLYTSLRRRIWSLQVIASHDRFISSITGPVPFLFQQSHFRFHISFSFLDFTAVSTYGWPYWQLMHGTAQELTPSLSTHDSHTFVIRTALSPVAPSDLRPLCQRSAIIEHHRTRRDKLYSYPSLTNGGAISSSCEAIVPIIHYCASVLPPVLLSPLRIT